MLILMSVLGCGFYAFKKGGSQEGQRKLKIAQAFDEFIHKNTDQTRVPTHLQENIKGRMNSKWVMRIESDDKSFLEEKAQINVNEVKFVEGGSMDFTMAIEDQVGESTATGKLVPSSDQESLSIIFEKTYRNREDAGQTESYDVLIYEGRSDGDCFEGKWYYFGHQDDSSCCGTWRMFHE